MKFGCIIKLFVIVIVVLGTSFYLFDKYGKNFISEGAGKAKILAIKNIEKLVDDISEKEIKDPLKQKFTELLDDVEKRKDEFSNDKFDEIVKKFNDIIKENNLDSNSLEDLKKMIILEK